VRAAEPSATRLAGAQARSDPGASPRIAVERTARGVSLRVDGTHASFYAPGRASTGPVWDALAAPLLALPPARRRRVLLLGLGGGSAARVVRALAPGARIVGVERSREVVRAARRHLGLDALGVEVVVDDALAFLERARGRYDLVLEDVFTGSGRAVRKPGWLPLPGLALAARLVAPGGLLATNTLDDAPASARALAHLFPARLRIAIDGWDNQIQIGGPTALSARRLRATLAATPLFAATLPLLRLRSSPRCVDTRQYSTRSPARS
jgi:SAM-dependent methyltransferase